MRSFDRDRGRAARTRQFESVRDGLEHGTALQEYPDRPYAAERAGCDRTQHELREIGRQIDAVRLNEANGVREQHCTGGAARLHGSANQVRFEHMLAIGEPVIDKWIDQRVPQVRESFTPRAPRQLLA